MVLLLAVAPGVAYAHATLLSSEPAAGSRLAESPRRVRLVFSEPLETDLGQIVLVSSGGYTTSLTVSADPHDVHALVAVVEPLAMGAYRVAWRVISADGHPVNGSFVFYVGATGSRIAPPLPPVLLTGSTAWGPSIVGAPLIPAVLRGLAVGCLMALGGLLLFLRWTRAGMRSRPARVALWLALVTPVLLALHLLAWLVNISPEHQLGAAWMSSALSTAVGRVELWRTGLALLALWALGLARRSGLALVFALAALAVSGAVGHSAAIHPLWAIPSKALHLIAVSTWLGGLLLLVLRVRDVEEGHGEDYSNEGNHLGSAHIVTEAARVSSVALVAVLVVAITGVVQTLLFLPSPVDILRSAYGAVVLAKIGGLGVLVAFGAYNRSRVLPRLRDRLTERTAAVALQSTVRRELYVMCFVTLLGGFLAYVPPPNGVSGHQSTSSKSAQ